MGGGAVYQRGGNVCEAVWTEEGGAVRLRRGGGGCSRQVTLTGPAHSVQSWCGQLLNISVGVAHAKHVHVEVFFQSTCPAPDPGICFMGVGGGGFTRGAAMYAKLFVCVCVYVYVYVCMCICVCVYVYVCMCMCMCMCVCVCVCVYVYVCMCMCMCMCTCICMCVCVYVCVCTIMIVSPHVVIKVICVQSDCLSLPPSLVVRDWLRYGVVRDWLRYGVVRDWLRYGVVRDWGMVL